MGFRVYLELEIDIIEWILYFKYEFDGFIGIRVVSNFRFFVFSNY